MASAIHPTAVIYPNVVLGDGVEVDEFVVLGTPPRGCAAGELETVIGDGAHLRSHTVIYAGTSAGAGFQTGHGALVREHNRIGSDVSIGSHAVLEHHIEVADGVRVHSGAFIPEYTVLEEGAWVGPNATFTNALHPLCPKAKQCLRGPRLRRGAKVGANCTLLPDIEIGEFALVGAGSVVTRDVPAHAVVRGNPARVLRTIEELDCPYELVESPYADIVSKGTLEQQ